MSVMMRTERRPWVWWAVGGGILVAALVLIGTLAVPADQPVMTSDAPAVTVGADGVALPQASWDVGVFPAGAGKPTKAQKAVVTAQRDDLKVLVENIYNALLMEGSVSSIKGKSITEEAGAALDRSKLLLPKGMSEVQTVKRVASIGVDTKATHAAAKVIVSFKGMLDGKPVRMMHRSTLWLQRGPRGWKVIAYSGEMGRLK